MAQKSSHTKPKKKIESRAIFESIRKPNAPPGHPLSRAKPDEIARPSQRKAKHKRPPSENGDEGS